MKQPDVMSTLVAGALGLGVLALLINFFDNTNPKPSTYLLFGFLTGVGVQLGVRLTGVS